MARMKAHGLLLNLLRADYNKSTLIKKNSNGQKHFERFLAILFVCVCAAKKCKITLLVSRFKFQGMTQDERWIIRYNEVMETVASAIVSFFCRILLKKVLMC